MAVDSGIQTSVSLRLRSPPNSTASVSGASSISLNAILSCLFLSSVSSVRLSRCDVINRQDTPFTSAWRKSDGGKGGVRVAGVRVGVGVLVRVEKHNSECVYSN